jgi:hypothetical protein
MPNEPEKTPNPEQTDTPLKRGGASKITDMIRKTRPSVDDRLLSGHPALPPEDEEEKPPGPDETGKGGPEAGKGKETAPPEKNDREGEEEDEDQGKKSGKFKYASHEEAEKAYDEVNKLASRKANEAQKFKEQNESLQAKLADLEGKFNDLQKQIQTRAAEIAVDEESEAQMLKHLQEMTALDREDPDYLKKMSAIWTKAIKSFLKTAAAAHKQAAKEIFDQEKAKTDEEAEAASQRRSLWDKANRLAAKAGLQMEDTGVDDDGNPVRSDDYVLFWRTAPDAPAHLDTDEKIEWAIKETKRLIGKLKKTAQEDKDKVRDIQNRNRPLGRGSAGPGGAPAPGSGEPKERKTINSILANQRRMRTI